MWLLGTPLHPCFHHLVYPSCRDLVGDVGVGGVVDIITAVPVSGVPPLGLPSFVVPGETSSWANTLRLTLPSPGHSCVSHRPACDCPECGVENCICSVLGKIPGLLGRPTQEECHQEHQLHRNSPLLISPPPNFLSFPRMLVSQGSAWAPVLSTLCSSLRSLH